MKHKEAIPNQDPVQPNHDHDLDQDPAMDHGAGPHAEVARSGKHFNHVDASKAHELAFVEDKVSILYGCSGVGKSTVTKFLVFQRAQDKKRQDLPHRILFLESEERANLGVSQWESLCGTFGEPGRADH